MAPASSEMAKLPPMATHVFGLSRRHANAPPITESEANMIQEAHPGHLRHLREQGDLILSGLSLDSGELQGILIFYGRSIDEVRSATANDPVLRTGRLVLELHELYAPAGLRAGSTGRASE